MKKLVVAILLILGCAATGFAGFWLAKHKMTVPDDVQTSATPPPAAIVSTPIPASESAADLYDDDEDPADITEITFSASGDDLIHSYLYEQAAERAGGDGYDFTYLYEHVSDFFEKKDLNWINQETLVTDTLEPSSYPMFSSPGDVAHELYDINFRVFNLSTNHSYDKGEDGLAQTYKFWKKMPEDCLATGVVKKNDYENIGIKTVNGVKFAFLSYTYGTNGLTVPSDSKYRVITLGETDIIKKQMKLAREQADVVIVSCHWGTEDSHTITSEQRTMAKRLTRWGADLIIGTHPHVVQDAEWVEAADRTAFCAYSLGNFVSGQVVADNLIGATLSLTFEIREDMLTDEKTVTIVKPKLIPNVTDYRSGHKNLSVYWLKDYPRELADSHGVRGSDSRFNYDYIFTVLKSTVNREFLKLPKKK